MTSITWPFAVCSANACSRSSRRSNSISDGVVSWLWMVGIFASAPSRCRETCSTLLVNTTVSIHLTDFFFLVLLLQVFLLSLTSLFYFCYCSLVLQLLLLHFFLFDHRYYCCPRLSSGTLTGGSAPNSGSILTRLQEVNCYHCHKYCQSWLVRVVLAKVVVRVVLARAHNPDNFHQLNHCEEQLKMQQSKVRELQKQHAKLTAAEDGQTRALGWDEGHQGKIENAPYKILRGDLVGHRTLSVRSITTQHSIV